MAEAQVTEARVEAMMTGFQVRVDGMFASMQQTYERRLGEVQTEMSKDLRQEFIDTQQASSDQVVTMQKTMSDDLRNEFAKSQAEFQEKLNSLTTLIGDTITTKFDDADQKFDEATQAEHDKLVKLTKDVSTAIESVNGLNVQKLAELDDFGKNFGLLRTDYMSVRAELFKVVPMAYAVRDEQLKLKSYTSDNLLGHWQAIQALQAGGPGAGGGGVGQGGPRTKGLEVRIPEPKNWSLDILKDGDT